MDEVNTPAWPAVSRRKPVVTYTLAAICAAVYLLEMLMGADSNTFILALMGAKVNPWIAAGEYWRLLSPVFLHGGLDHLAFNLYALVVWGRVLEAMYGRAKYLAIYLIAGVFGNLCSYVFSPYLAVGASGAIFGLFGALLYFRKKDKIAFNAMFGMQVLLIIGFNLFYGFIRTGIDNFAHIGGLLGGFLAALALGLYGERVPKARRIAVIAGMAVLAGAAIVAGQIMYLPH